MNTSFSHHFLVLTGTMLLLTMAVSPAGRAQQVGDPQDTQSPLTSPAPAEAGLDFFRILYQNNVFDPNRRPYRPPEPQRERPVIRTPEINSFSLNGIMNYDGKSLAIFNGSSSSYSGIKNPGDKVGDFTLSKVLIDSVILVSDSSEDEKNLNFDLKIGEAYSREDEGPWKKGTASVSSGSSRRSFSSSRSSSRSPSSSSRFGQSTSSSSQDYSNSSRDDEKDSADDEDTDQDGETDGDSDADESSDADDILRRLLERRRQQME